MNAILSLLIAILIPNETTNADQVCRLKKGETTCNFTCWDVNGNMLTNVECTKLSDGTFGCTYCRYGETVSCVQTNTGTSCWE